MFFQSDAGRGWQVGTVGPAAWQSLSRGDGEVLAASPAGTPAATAPSPRLSSDFMNVYYQIRSSQLDRSIRGLKEHFRKSSSSSGVPYSPAVPNKRKDTPTKKPVKRPGESPPQPIKHQPEGQKVAWDLDCFQPLWG